ncbi:ABC transporter ATP-binding protein/permease [Anaerosoma tenue]|uniref:ABC transporter ATP-binding protein/permease n=1 Tax=Anaerosoma tenue TaxID=2933588 RepID=UPI002260B836|nr:ABC transporter ATP-binding protein/permease [Anaerosoma tenue]MCK8115342.1 ABC transporter ATP-binding protein/permease [Anaerosoma tenue]
MLQLHNISKSYTTGDFTQVALGGVSIAFRDSEFVAVLGPSGSGKTTLLNIVGGLDQYDSGNLVIDGVATEDYKDRDWDTYRNNRIGFVFQSYNLIPHQTVLSNVELALTLSGVSRLERRRRAIDALEQVGLKDHVHKKPNQLSGGQMQRVAIARALINDPEILLADEPTGALDTHTSAQVMALLTEIANDRLVIMVTHNPELAETYATRTVNLLDGQLADDSDPYWPQEDATRLSQKSTRKTSMSFLTAIALSFNNLMTKKGRTLMTAFAGSIGIIGIAAILALANGVNEYIASVEEDALSLYPLTIQSQGMDFTSLFAASGDMAEGMDEGGGTGAVADGSDVRELRMMTRMFESVGSNDLAALKVYLDGNGGGINDHVNLIHYSYNVTPQIFSPDTSGGVRQVNPDTTFSALGFGASSNSLMASSMNTNVFGELVDDIAMIEDQYDVMAGRWPAAHNETVVVLTPNGGVSDFMAYAMGLRDAAELDAMVEQMINDEEIVTPGDTQSYTYDQLMGVSFKLVNATDYYAYDEQYDVWTDKRTDTEYLKRLVEDGEDIRVVGVIQAKDGATATALQPGIYYTSALTAHLVSEAAGTEIVRMQLDEPATNVFSGRTFLDEEENPDRDGFDLASLVTVDEGAMASMFSFDASQLAFDASALDISMEDFSLDPSAMPALDTTDLLAGLDLDDALAGLDLTEGLGEIDLEAALADIDFAALIDGIDFGVDAEQAADVANRMVQGYLEFCTAEGLDPVDTQANFPLFLESTDGEAILAEAEALFSGAETGLSELQSRLLAALTESLGDAVQSQIDSVSAAIGEQLQASMAAYMQQVLSMVAEQVTTELGTALQEQIGAALESSMSQLTNDMSGLMGMDADAFSEIFQFNMDEEELTQLMLSMMVTEQSSYDGNLAKLGYADFAKPSSIDIYPLDFESKGRVIEILDGYNEQMESEGADDKVITYTDIVGTLMSSVTDIVNVVSYVLVAFVAISLVVSSIMIGVITYISVLERIKEIGILRSIGASKRDIRRVFNAETLIVGFVAGLLGIGVTRLLIIPANAVINASFDIENVAILPGIAAAALVVISMGLTFLAGLIPSSAASHKDPVEALRSE